MHLFRFFVAVCLLAFTSSFAQSPFAAPQHPPSAAPAAASSGAPAQEPTNTTSAAASLAGVSAPSGYQLAPSDQVAVEVFGEDDLRTNGRLNSEGNLSLPLLGSVHLAGLTLNQATARLMDLYGRDYLVNPKLSVSLISYAKRRFTMLGEVNHPGSFEMPEGNPDGIDLLEAVAMAGGYTRIAAPERITVRRRVNGRDQVMRIDGKRMARGAANSFEVVAGDTVTVGQSIF
jgi:protein involved in polysaccharide export with SLBB domain